MTPQIIEFLVGFIVLTAIIFVISRVKGVNQKPEFDERQLMVRGNAFKYGFYTVLIGLACQLTVFISNDSIAGFYYISVLLILAAGLTVYVVYSVMNDAFIGINTNATSTLIIDGFIALVNIVAGTMQFITHKDELALDGYVPGLMNIILAGIFIILFVALLIKKLIDKKEA